jgi:O-antigen ligase
VTWTSVLHWTAVAVYVLLAAECAGDRLLTGFGIFAAVLVPLSLVQYFTSGGLVFWLFPGGYDTALGPFLNRNTFASFCEIALPVVVWLGIERQAWRAPALVSAGLILAAPVATGARTGTVLLVVEAAVIAAAARCRLRPALLAGALASLFLLFAAAAGWQSLTSRLHDQDPWAFRREAALSSIDMLRARPGLGFGLDSFPHAYPAYALVDYGVVLNHAHNDWLEFAVEGGLPLGFVLLAAAGLAVRRGMQAIWGLGLPFVFLHALVDYPLHVDAVLTWVLLIAGAAMGLGKTREYCPSRKPI